jgi:hypothetical protein
MGYGSYSIEAHRALLSERASLEHGAVFTRHAVDPAMDPRGVALRESRDSEAHPESVGIVFALDISGSMGEVPHQLATRTLPTFMEAVLAVLPDPQILFMALADARWVDFAPLQVGQFESEAALMDRWLASTFLPAPGWNPPQIPPQYLGESYDLAMYFAARHTSMDCLGKRGKRGYFFMTGDEVPLAALDPEHVRRALGDGAQEPTPIHRLVAELERSFEPFFVIPDRWRAERDGCERVWRKLLHERCVVLECAEDTAVAAALLIGIGEGTLASRGALEEVLQKRLGRRGEERDRVVRAVLPYAEARARGAIAAPEPLAKRQDCDAACE